MSKPNIPDAKTTEKVSVSEVEIQEFVNSNIVPLERKEVNGKKVLKNSVCVDGRTEPEDSKGRVHMFGGDSALLLSFVATLNEEAIEKYNDEIIYALIDAKKEIEREDAKLCLHTDKHGKKAGTIGCGHANRASSNKEEHNGDGKYGLTWNSAKELFEKAWEMPEAEHVVLEGEHEELAVLIVHGGEKGESAGFSINSLDKASGKSFFVIDEEATEEYFKTYVPIMSRKLGVNISEENVLKNYLKQAKISAGLLAVHLEQFDVNIDSLENTRVGKAS